MPPNRYKYSDRYGTSPNEFQAKEILCPHCNNKIVLDIWIDQIVTAILVHKNMTEQKAYFDSLPQL